jgi:MoxR-like ATPase
LPEAQVDRFMMKVLVDYPSEDEEFAIVQRVTGPAVAIAPVASAEELLAMQSRARAVYVDPALVSYAVRLVSATRAPEKAGRRDYGRFILYGASPRATIGLIEAGRALAFLRGRDYALPQDVIDIAADVLRHRVVPSYEALSEGISADRIVADIMRGVAPPEKVLESHVRIASA